jgi:hypothetical protein
MPRRLAKNAAAVREATRSSAFFFIATPRQPQESRGDCRLSCGCRDVASSPLGDRLLAARAPPSLRVLAQLVKERRRPSPNYVKASLLSEGEVFFLAAPVLFIALSETLRRFIRGATASEALHFIHQKSCGEVRRTFGFPTRR